MVTVRRDFIVRSETLICTDAFADALMRSAAAMLMGPVPG
jgi:hypothetical protein